MLEQRMEQRSIVPPCLRIRGENPISKGLENLTKFGAFHVVVKILAHHVVHVDGVTSDHIVHFGKPRPSEFTSSPSLFQYIGDEIMDPPQVPQHLW